MATPERATFAADDLATGEAVAHDRPPAGLAREAEPRRLTARR